jgi:hypothetical protein
VSIKFQNALLLAAKEKKRMSNAARSLSAYGMHDPRFS